MDCLFTHSGYLVVIVGILCHLVLVTSVCECVSEVHIHKHTLLAYMLACELLFTFISIYFYLLFTNYYLLLLLFTFIRYPNPKHQSQTNYTSILNVNVVLS